MRVGLVLAVVVGALASFLYQLAPLGPAPAAHADGIEVRSQSVQNRFPQGLQFALFVAAGGDITDARLHYSLVPETVEAQVKATCTPGSTSNCTVTVGASSASYLVPGATVQYFWEVRDSAGNTLRTDPQQTQYMDSRFQWDSKSSGKVTAFFHAGTDQSIDAILQAANESVTRMSALLRTQIDFQIKVWVYENPGELSAAASPGSQATGGILEGQVVAADTALVSKDQTTLDTVRHEVTHVVVDRASRGFIVPIPTWVNEGLAVYSQKAFDSGWQQSLDLAIRRNRPLPIESLGDSTRSNSDFSLFYAESGSLIRFLVSNYGDDKFGQFFAALGKDTINGSLKSVYGFDEFGLENAWRNSVGLPPVDATAISAANASPTAVPANQSRANTSATPANDGQSGEGKSSSGGSSNSLVIVVAVLTGVVALGVLGAGLYYARKQA